MPVADRYDVALLDCAPGITLTSESVFDAADALIVPTAANDCNAISSHT